MSIFITLIVSLVFCYNDEVLRLDTLFQENGVTMSCVLQAYVVIAY